MTDSGCGNNKNYNAMDASDTEKDPYSVNDDEDPNYDGKDHPKKKKNRDYFRLDQKNRQANSQASTSLASSTSKATDSFDSRCETSESEEGSALFNDTY